MRGANFLPFGPRILVPALAFVITGCLTPPARECDGDGECRLEGREGRCEAIGYCAYPNGACEQGWSFSPYAPEGLANSCVTADAGTGGTSGANPGGTLALEVLGPWTLATSMRLVGAVMPDGAALVVGGDSGSAAEVVDLDRGVVFSWPDASLVGLATDGRTIYAGTNRSGQPGVAALTVELESAWTRNWPAVREGDALVGIGTAPDGGVVVGGQSLGRPWVEQLDASGTPQWMRQWDPGTGPAAVEVLLARGGRSGAIGTGATGLVLRRFDADGGLHPPEPLDSSLAGAILGASVTQAGFSFATSQQVWVGGHGHDDGVAFAIEPVTQAAVARDGAHHVVVARFDGALSIDLLDPDGVLRASSVVSESPVDGVTTTVDGDGLVIVVARLGTADVGAWRVLP